MNHFARSSLIVALFFGIDKVIALVRSLIIARQFGLSYEMDVFNAANNIPDLLSSLISGGALGVALIPVLSEYLEKRGREDAWELFSRIVNFAFIVTGVIAILVGIFTVPLVSNVIAPGFPAEQKALAVELMRLDLIAILVFSISGLVMAGLNANQHFVLPALAPIMYNVGQIFGATVLAADWGLGLGVHGLVYGVILGSFLHLAIQIPGLIKYKFKWIPKIGLDNPGVKQVLGLLGPRVATMLFIKMFLIVRDNLASHLTEGSLSAINLGWFIMQVPETLLGTAIAITLLPTISELLARGEKDKFSETVNQAARAMLSMTIPVAALLAVGLPPLVQLAFSFSPEGTALVVLATRAYLLGLAGHALLEIAARSFYAQQDAKTPLLAAAINAAAYLIFAVTLSKLLGFFGIALANSIAFTTEALLLLFILNRRFPGILAIRSTLTRVLIVSAAAGGILYFVLNLGPVTSLSLKPLAAVSAAGMLVALLGVTPFVWSEVKLLIRIGD